MATVLVGLIYLVTLFIQGAIKWRDQGFGNLLSCMIVVLSFPAGVLLGHALRTSVFSYKLDHWNEAVTWVVKHRHPNSGGPIKLPPKYVDLAYGVHYKTDKLCGLTVDFFWAGGFPVKHTVRRYATNPEWINLKKCRADWSRGRQLTGNWYEISD